MFTGIIEELGEIKALIKGDKSMKLKVGCSKITNDLSLAKVYYTYLGDYDKITIQEELKKLYRIYYGEF